MSLTQIYTQSQVNLIISVALLAIALSFSAGFILGMWKGVKDERKEAESLKKPYSRPERKLRIVSANGQPEWFKAFVKKKAA